MKKKNNSSNRIETFLQRILQEIMKEKKGLILGTSDIW